MGCSQTKSTTIKDTQKQIGPHLLGHQKKLAEASVITKDEQLMLDFWTKHESSCSADLSRAWDEASASMKDSATVVLHVMKMADKKYEGYQDCKSLDILKKASDRIRDTELVALEAVKLHHESWYIVGPNCRDNLKIFYAALESWNEQFEQDGGFCDPMCHLFHAASDRLKTSEISEDVILGYIKLHKDGRSFRDTRILAHLPDRMRASKPIVLACVERDPEDLRFALNGLNQDSDCLRAAGLWSAEEEYTTAKTKPQALYSVKFSLGEKSSPYATTAALELSKQPYMSQFNIYFPSAFCKKSCDPDFTNFEHPCRGTVDTCCMIHDSSAADSTDKICWRFSYRQHQQRCKPDGFMLQFVENGVLGDGQRIELDMARLEGLKVFQVFQGSARAPGLYYRESFAKSDAESIAAHIRHWYETNEQCPADSVQEITEIHLSISESYE